MRSSSLAAISATSARSKTGSTAAFPIGTEVRPDSIAAESPASQGPLCYRPGGAVAEFEAVEALGLHGDAVAGQRGRHIAAGAHAHGIDEVLVQMVDEFQHPALHAGADADEIDHRQMLDIFAEADAAGMRADGNAELLRQEQDRQHLVDPAQAAGIDLAEIDGAGLH